MAAPPTAAAPAVFRTRRRERREDVAMIDLLAIK
jgi:hypothetical protein